jgi:hypothetical protein
MKQFSLRHLPVLILIGITFAAAAPALAERDFLTEAEIAKVRDAQEPSERLKLYVLFARQRIDQLQRLLSKEKKGRSAEARELLEDYGAIIDAIDTVTDDALKRGAETAEGTTAVVTAEKRFLGQLQQIKDRNLSDVGLYEVALREAIASTSDSIAQAAEDATGRGTKLAEADKRKKQEAEETLAAEDRKGKPPEEAKEGEKSTDVAKADDKQQRRKPPTLLRPGEKPPDK